MSAAIRAARRALHTDASSSVQHYDALVVGLGAYGSSALYHLAGAGAKVAGLDRFPPGHDNGSSHGLSRITRLPYFEGPSYVPLVAASLSLFRRLEREAGQARDSSLPSLPQC